MRKDAKHLIINQTLSIYFIWCYKLFIMNYEKLKIGFDSLTEKGQWAWAANHKAEITLDLDNDNTTFTFDKELKTDDCTLFMFKADIGNRWGVPFLLNAVGFKGYNV